MKFNLFLLFLTLASMSVFGQAETCTLVTSGDSGGGGAAVWSCDQGSTTPSDMTADPGNLVIIPANLVYTNDANQVWESSILIAGETSLGAADGGTLIFEKRIELGTTAGCGYTMIVETGGLIDNSGAGGGNDRLIICGETIIGNGNGLITTWPPGGFTGPFTVDEDGGSLPVELIYFNAQKNEGKVILFWATASEENFDYFSVERSSDGTDFKEIGRVFGSGYSSSRLDYSFTDALPLIGHSYYRLRSIDFDGYTEVFETVLVEVEAGAYDFIIYPNPIQNNSFSIQTNFTDTKPVTLMVYSSMGQVEAEFTLDSWLETHELHLTKKGIYLFKLFTAHGTLVKRVLVN